MPVTDAPDDDETRQSYNFAPGYHGLVYRADVPDSGAGNSNQRQEQVSDDEDDGNLSTQMETPKEPRYKLQSMKWGIRLSPGGFTVTDG